MSVLHTTVLFWAAVVVAGGSACSGDAVVQPLPFNHKVHTVDEEISCDECHQGVMEGPHAGPPRVATCMECHDTDITDKPEAKPHIELLRKYAEQGQELPWQRLYVLPTHVFYSHRRHAKVANLPCERCHGEIGKSTTPPRHPISATLQMDTCLDCHEHNKVTKDCAACHR